MQNISNSSEEYSPICICQRKIDGVTIQCHSDRKLCGGFIHALCFGLSDFQIECAQQNLK